MNIIRRLLFGAVLFVSIFAGGNCLLAQEKIIIKGKIQDNNSGDGIPYAMVQIVGENVFTSSDESGLFKVTVSKENEVTLKITHLTYGDYEVKIDPEEDQDLKIRMQVDPTLLEEILIEDLGKPLLNQRKILAKEIMRRNPKDVGDIFSNEMGFGVIKRGGYAMDPVFRSFKYEQLNLVYDGGVYVSNACPNRMDPASTHVNPAEINRIELIKGPYSLRYGPTMGAIINIITHKPSYTEKLKIGGSIDGGYEFNGNGVSGRADLSVSNKNYDLLLNGGLMDYGNYVSGDGDEVPSSFKTYDYAVKLGLAPKTNHRLQLAWRQSFGRDIMHAALPMDSDEDNSSIFSADYAIVNPSKNITSIAAKGYYSYVDHIMSNKNRPNYKMVEATSPVISSTAGGRFELGLKPTKKMLLYTGLDMRTVSKNGHRERLVKVMNGQPLEPPKLFTDKIWQDSWMNNLGIFAEANWHLSDRWDLVTGARVDYVKSGADDPAMDFEELYGEINPQTDWNGSITGSVRYLPNSKSMYQLSIGRGQRSPDLLERYINHFQVGMDAYEYVGNPYLIPEINNQVDLSATGYFGRFEVTANVFYSYFQHYITAVVDENLPRKYMPNMEPVYAKRFINIDQAWQTGFDINAFYRITDYLKLTGGVFYTRAQNLDFDEPLPEIPPFTGLLSLLFEKDKVWAEFKGRLVAKQDKVSESFNESESPGFEVFDLMAGYSPWKNLTISLQLKNIFNENYYEHLSRSYKNQSEQMMFYEPGRQLRIGLKLSF